MCKWNRDLIWAVGCPIALCIWLVCAGCETPGRYSSGVEHVKDDVVAIRHFYNPLPWLKDADGRFNGFYVRAYFVSSRTDKGIFVPGPIKVWMRTLTVRPDGTYARELAHEWSLDQRTAGGFRVRDPSIMGESYGFVLRWPPEVEVMGQEIELVFGYKRSDGRLITGPPRHLRVPLPVRQRLPGRPRREDASTPSRGAGRSSTGEGVPTTRPK